jgi:hypothetical protein
MTRWPASWPPEAADWYESLARRYGWNQPAVDGVIASVEYLRQLAESDLPRSYLQADAGGERWLWEAVKVGGELVAVRQVEISRDGSVRRYSWQRREDDAGFLTDQALELPDGTASLTGEAFASAWSASGEGSLPPADSG